MLCYAILASSEQIPNKGAWTWVVISILHESSSGWEAIKLYMHADVNISLLQVASDSVLLSIKYGSKY